MSESYVSIDTRILTSDLRYVRAQDIRVGEHIIGFDVNIAGQGKRRRFKSSVITSSDSIEFPCIRVTLSDDTNFYCSSRHRVLVPRATGANWHWEECGRLQLGAVFTRMMPIFDFKETYNTGYLAGFYDGEGSICGSKRENKGIIRVSCSQKGGKTMGLVLSMLEEMGYKVSTPYENGTPEQYDMVYHWYLCGKVQCIKFLGEVRPKRLIKNLNINAIGALHVFKEDRTFVTDVADVGLKDMRTITTTTNTFIADGFASYHYGVPMFNGKYDYCSGLDTSRQVR